MDLTKPKCPSVTIDIDEISKNATLHKRSVKSYASRVLQESTSGIVSTIFTTDSKWRKFFKVFFSSLCIAGFIYHCESFLNHVLQYPEVVNIYVDKWETYDIPAYTYCNNNPIRRSVFCKLQPQHCVQPSEEFCKKFSSYCGTNATLIPKKEYYFQLPQKFRAEWILKFGGIPNVLGIPQSSINKRDWKHVTNEISGPYIRSSSLNFYELKTCYSVHSSVESNQKPLQKGRAPKKVTHEYPDEILEFYLNETEMMNPRNEPGIYFSVHSPFEAINPLTKGIFMKGGKTYDLHVEMVCA